MPNLHVYRTEAIVLRHTDFGEADKTLTIYTPEHGKIRVVARGIARPTSKMGGHLETFTCSRLQLVKGRNLDLVTQCETAQSFPRLRDDLGRTALAFHLAEVIDRLAGEHIPNLPAYDLLLESLRRLDADDPPDMAVRLFEMQALGMMGYRPELRQCLCCRQEAKSVTNYFSSSAGGLLCPECGRIQGGLTMSVNALKLLRLLQAGDYATVRRVQTGTGLRTEIETILCSYLQYLLEQRLRSYDLVNSVRRMEGR